MPCFSESSAIFCTSRSSGELDVVAGLGRRVAQHLHEATAAVDLEPARPRHAAQLRLEELLDALLADLVALAVALALVDLELVLVDRGDVADEVRGAGRRSGSRASSGGVACDPREQLRVLLDVDERCRSSTCLATATGSYGENRGLSRSSSTDFFVRRSTRAEVRRGDVGLLRRQAALDRHLVDQRVLDDRTLPLGRGCCPRTGGSLIDADAVLLGLRGEARRVRRPGGTTGARTGPRTARTRSTPTTPRRKPAVALGHERRDRSRGSVMTRPCRRAGRRRPAR